ncbi:response regulator transcription factor [Actinoplanes sp. KI2]|uniref:response regulator n=1 Tax=Actinoplanes sp. KI2 TaxID=2983315 RepID=UPI0021D5B3E7|nr:response regulator transcription factor [Actinoplanes sp. KI2]MCU7722323.1 response regulator transcription factor [Actinoplanes sp. KI2]
MTLRVLIVDDQELIRVGFRVLIDSAADMSTVGEAADGVVAIAEAMRLRPDVVLMDIRMPVMDGIEATRRICAEPELAGVRVLVLTTFGDDENVFAALRAGASGFLLKDARPADLLAAVRTVAAGESLLSPRVTSVLIERFLAEREPRGPAVGTVAQLTDREREVLTLVARGRSNEELAAELVISPLTAKTHVSHIRTKLGAHDRAQLVMLAYESGLVHPGA